MFASSSTQAAAWPSPAPGNANELPLVAARKAQAAAATPATPAVATAAEEGAAVEARQLQNPPQLPPLP